MSHWDESKHPRVPAGNEDGGQFTVKVAGGQYNNIERLRAQHSGVRVSGDTFRFSQPDAKQFVQSVNQRGGGAFASIVPPHMRGK